jgi:hypothetical protein
MSHRSTAELTPSAPEYDFDPGDITKNVATLLEYLDAAQLTGELLEKAQAQVNFELSMLDPNTHNFAFSFDKIAELAGSTLLVACEVIEGREGQTLPVGRLSDDERERLVREMALARPRSANQDGPVVVWRDIKNGVLAMERPWYSDPKPSAVQLATKPKVGPEREGYIWWLDDERQ